MMFNNFISEERPATFYKVELTVGFPKRMMISTKDRARVSSISVN